MTPFTKKEIMDGYRKARRDKESPQLDLNEENSHILKIYNEHFTMWGRFKQFLRRLTIDSYWFVFMKDSYKDWRIRRALSNPERHKELLMKTIASKHHPACQSVGVLPPRGMSDKTTEVVLMSEQRIKDFLGQHSYGRPSTDSTHTRVRNENVGSRTVVDNRIPNKVTINGKTLEEDHKSLQRN